MRDNKESVKAIRKSRKSKNVSFDKIESKRYCLVKNSVFNNEVFYEYYSISYSPPKDKNNRDEYDKLELNHKNYLLEIYWTKVPPSDMKNEDFVVTSDTGLKKTWHKRWQRVKDDKTYLQIGLNIINRILNDPEFLNCLIAEKFYEIPKEEVYIINKAGLTSHYLTLVDYSKDLLDTFNLSSDPPSSKNHHLGKFKRNEADKFAQSMTKFLEEARKNNNFSTREIADYFNKNNIHSAQGKNWSANSVSQLIRRRKALGLEHQEINKTKKRRIKSNAQLSFAKEFGKALNKVKSEGYSSTRQIAKRFNELGITTKTGKKWSHVSVHNMIKKREELGLE
tara:strand:+ start:20673 stop:21683 length:1011 start_codon:yes stop_codon:yes gene_type:complete